MGWEETLVFLTYPRGYFYPDSYINHDKFVIFMDSELKSGNVLFFFSNIWFPVNDFIASVFVFCGFSEKYNLEKQSSFSM